MGYNQRIRKEQKMEEKKAIKEEIRSRGREKAKQKSLPIVSFLITIILTVALIWSGKVLLNKLSKMPVDKAKTVKSATIVTEKGKIEFEFYKNDAPKTVENFVLLSRRGYYNGVKFHRFEPGFVIQGGDPLSKDDDPTNDGTGGESAWGGKFDDELNPQTSSYKAGYLRGVVAMANSGPNTNGSQFFIILKDQPTLDKNYTIFGKVKVGMDVVDKIVKDDVINKVLINEGPE